MDWLHMGQRLPSHRKLGVQGKGRTTGCGHGSVEKLVERSTDLANFIGWFRPGWRAREDATH